MDIYNLSGRLGQNPKRADGTKMSYLEQCAYTAGCLEVWFSLLSAGRTSIEEIAKFMSMRPPIVAHMYKLWLAEITL